MISNTLELARQLQHFTNRDDAEFISKLDDIQVKLRDIQAGVVAEVAKDLSKLQADARLGAILQKFSRIEKDWVYKIEQAFLRPREIKTGNSERIVCVLSRAMICRQVALEHLKSIQTYMSELQVATSFIKGKRQISTSRVRELFELGRKVDKIRGSAREVVVAIKDYCHFMDYVYHLVGDEADLFGKRFKTDVLPLQLDKAIRELFFSRTESHATAAFLIRSLLEIRVRRSIFSHHNKTAHYLPSPNLALSYLLKSCKKVAIEFYPPYSVLETM